MIDNRKNRRTRNGGDGRESSKNVGAFVCDLALDSPVDAITTKIESV